MNHTKNQQSRQDLQHGHQNQNDPQNKQDSPQKHGVNDSKEGQQRQGIGTPHDKNDKQPTR